MKVKRVLKKLARFALDVLVVIFGLCVIVVGKYVFGLGFQAFTLQNVARILEGGGLMLFGFVVLVVGVEDVMKATG